MAESILIVDDHREIRSLLKLVCRQLGFKTIEADNNTTAMSLAKTERPILVTTDNIRPGGLGIEFVQAMRNSEYLSSIPILMITGNANKDDELRAWRAGVSAFLPKPIGFDQLASTILRLTKRVSNIDALLLDLGQEGIDLDYKEKIDFSSKMARAELARDIIALANAGGGRLIIGIAERDGRFVHVGLQQTDLAEYETTRFNDKIRRYIGSTARVSTRIESQEGMFFVFVEVQPNTDTLAVAIESNQDAGLFTGRIY